MWFAARVALILTCCAALLTLACASDAGDEEAELVSKDTELARVEDDEKVDAPDTEPADVVPASTDQPIAADHGYTGHSHYQRRRLPSRRCFLARQYVGFRLAF